MIPQSLADFGSRRIRALLSLGILLGFGSVSTLAAWSDSATATSGTFQTAKLDVLLNGGLAGQGGTTALSSFTLTNMIPGESVATTIAVGRDIGSVAFTYDLSGTASVANALSTATLFKVYAGTAGSSSTNANGLRTQSCGGTQIFGGSTGAALGTSATTLVSGRTVLATPLALPTVVQTDNLCVQAILPAATPNTAQSLSFTTTFSFTANQLS